LNYPLTLVINYTLQAFDHKKSLMTITSGKDQQE